MTKPYKAPEENIDDITLLEPEATYSYSDYLKWSFEERVELIKGKVFRMSPAPNRAHQQLSGRIFLTIGNFLNQQPCEVYAAPFDVRLPKSSGDPDQEIYTVVQPDLCVICDPTKLDDAGCNGAPDLIIEILSPLSAAKDLKNKFELYEENAVKEYWIVYPSEQFMEIFRLENGKYGKPVRFVKGDSVQSEVLSGLEIEVSEIFRE